MSSKNLRIEILKKWIGRTPEGKKNLTLKYKRKTSTEKYMENVFGSLIN